MENTKNSLKPQDLVKIIESGKKCGVAEISWNNLKITYNFIDKPEKSINSVGIPLKMDPRAAEGEDSLDDLMISDPVAYEEALLNGIETEENSGT